MTREILDHTFEPTEQKSHIETASEMLASLVTYVRDHDDREIVGSHQIFPSISSSGHTGGLYDVSDVIGEKIQERITFDKKGKYALIVEAIALNDTINPNYSELAKNPEMTLRLTLVHSDYHPRSSGHPDPKKTYGRIYVDIGEHEAGILDKKEPGEVKFEKIYYSNKDGLSDKVRKDLKKHVKEYPVLKLFTTGEQTIGEHKYSKLKRGHLRAIKAFFSPQPTPPRLAA